MKAEYCFEFRGADDGLIPSLGNTRYNEEILHWCLHEYCLEQLRGIEDPFARRQNFWEASVSQFRSLTMLLYIAPSLPTASVNSSVHSMALVRRPRRNLVLVSEMERKASQESAKLGREVNAM